MWKFPNVWNVDFASLQVSFSVSKVFSGRIKLQRVEKSNLEGLEGGVFIIFMRLSATPLWAFRPMPGTRQAVICSQ